MTNFLITIAARINGRKSRGPKTPQAFLAVTDNSKGIHLTRTYRKAMDELRCLRTENIKKKNRVLQNEPKDLGLSPLNATKDAATISTEPKEPSASPPPPLCPPAPNQRPDTRRSHPSVPVLIYLAFLAFFLAFVARKSYFGQFAAPIAFTNCAFFAGSLMASAF